MAVFMCHHDPRTELCWYGSDDGRAWLRRFVAAERAWKEAFHAAVFRDGAAVDHAAIEAIEAAHPFPELPVLTCSMMRLRPLTDQELEEEYARWSSQVKLAPTLQSTVRAP